MGADTTSRARLAQAYRIQRRSPPLRLPAWQAAAAVRAARAAAASSAARPACSAARPRSRSRRSSAPRRKSPKQLSDALVTAGKERRLTIVPSGSKATTRCAAISSPPPRARAPRSPISGTSMTPGGQRVARVSGDEVVPAAPGAILGQCRQCGDPQHRRQDPRRSPRACRAAAARPAPWLPRRIRRRTATASTAAAPPQPPRRPRPMAWSWRPLPARLATAELAHHRPQEAALCGRR